MKRRNINGKNTTGLAICDSSSSNIVRYNIRCALYNGESQCANREIGEKDVNWESVCSGISNTMAEGIANWTIEARFRLAHGIVWESDLILAFFVDREGEGVKKMGVYTGNPAEEFKSCVESLSRIVNRIPSTQMKQKRKPIPSEGKKFPWLEDESGLEELKYIWNPNFGTPALSGIRHYINDPDMLDYPVYCPVIEYVYSPISLVFVYTAPSIDPDVLKALENQDKGLYDETTKQAYMLASRMDDYKVGFTPMLVNEFEDFLKWATVNDITWESANKKIECSFGKILKFQKDLMKRKYVQMERKPVFQEQVPGNLDYRKYIPHIPVETIQSVSAQVLLQYFPVEKTSISITEAIKYEVIASGLMVIDGDGIPYVSHNYENRRFLIPILPARMKYLQVMVSQAICDSVEEITQLADATEDYKRRNFSG